MPRLFANGNRAAYIARARVPSRSKEAETSKTAAEALIRGRATNTIVAALRAAIARAWLTISLT